VHRFEKRLVDLHARGIAKDTINSTLGAQRRGIVINPFDNSFRGKPRSAIEAAAKPTTLDVCAMIAALLVCDAQRMVLRQV